MSFLGMNLGEEAPRGYRWRRLAAFAVDVVIVLCILMVTYRMTGKPDFPAVKAALDAIQAGPAAPGNQELANRMLKLFNTAYVQTLLIWFLYEVTSQLIFSGATLGKLVMKLRVVSWNPQRKRLLHHLMMIVRSGVKFLSIYLFQGFPFLIASLSIFTNRESRSGFDMMARTSVNLRR
ncbi:RDD family protein [Anoxybacterium hadale]|uniref:RDD family protein n=1 Tax=Anoxybacterium hadale TaxID=3408580 RepID=UPI003B00966D